MFFRSPLENIMKLFIFIFIIFFYFNKQNFLLAQSHLYKHYSRHSVSNTIYDNETLADIEDDSNMCQLAVKCPTVSKLCK